MAPAAITTLGCHGLVGANVTVAAPVPFPVHEHDHRSVIPVQRIAASQVTPDIPWAALTFTRSAVIACT